ncbi:DeoR/GlpR family DNA-binding transcription regulator [Fulvivirga maritima]|uniref:DeoR/GlpR family DNA-binding transcription regulator n=1 Tax=Fulvivirga maritima TaxID=2904247 RepID=UPI001F274E40|nr:DeoR/GlpR family DNA-binding transcription regulator [Fulvivirga maritima]UII25463.1 DeoR/GlpR family DNA-binding transcription regulator [Fulvivirga maritima]
MLKEERFQHILKELNLHHKVYLDQLSTLLEVSIDTIRRDIKELDSQGQLKAVRGGAIAHSTNPHNFMDRLDYDSEAKQLIAKKAIPLFHNGQTVIFDGGTSTLAIAHMLPDDLHITVATNSFPVVTILKDRKNIKVLFAGGQLFNEAFVTTGYDTINFFKDIRADLCFLGICSLHHEHGVTAPNYEESKVKKVMTESSLQTIALATPKKLDTAEPYFVCGVDKISTIITSNHEDQKLTAFHQLGIEVL